MQKIKLYLFAAIATLLIVLTSSCNEETDISIVYTSDLYGFTYPYDYQTDDSSRPSQANFMTLVKEQRKAYGEGHCLVLDNGNKAVGRCTSFYYNFIDKKCQPLCYRAEREIGYDACGVGYRDAEMNSFLHPKNYNPADQPPYICANLIDIKTGKPHFTPYYIKDCDGIKVAVLAMMSPMATTWIPKEELKNLTCEDMIECAQKWMKVIREQEKPDVVVGLFSCYDMYNAYGNTIDTYKNPHGGVPAAIRVPGFDVVLLGGVGEKKERVFDVRNDAGDNVTCIQISDASLSAGNVRIHVKKEKGECKKRIFASIVNLKMYEPDEEFCEKFKDAHDSIYSWFNKPIGFLKDSIFGDNGFYGPDSYRQFIHNVQLWATKADVSFCGVLLAGDTIPSGPITMKRIFKIYPYENNLCVMNMIGEDIRRYLEASAKQQFEPYNGPTTNLLALRKDKFGHIIYNESSHTYLKVTPDRFQSAGGIKYVIDMRKPEGSRVTILSMADGRPFDLKANYRVAMNSYSAKDGDQSLSRGLGWNEETIKIHLLKSGTTSIRELMQKYLATQKDTIKLNVTNNWSIEPHDWWLARAKYEKATQNSVWYTSSPLIKGKAIYSPSLANNPAK